MKSEKISFEEDSVKNWKEIWNNEERVNDYILETLIKADGFEVGAGSFTLQNWKDYTAELIHLLEVEASDSIYDVGCGSGAFLYPLFLRGHKIGGVDYSEPLISLAKTVMPQSDFSLCEASMIKTKNKFDIVFSHSTFQYFSSLEYAESVLEKMLAKTFSKLAIFDVNDKVKEEFYHIVRMGSMNPEEYKEKYTGLNHLFYDKDWFKGFAEKHNLRVKVFDQTFEKYGNSNLRFNVIMEKQ